MAGWTVQDTSAGGTSWSATLLSGTIPAHGFYLIQQAAGSGGTLSLPTPDAIGNIAMGATEGKVALVSGSALLTGACPLASTLDFVGYGGANCFEGTGAAPSLSNTTAAQRLNDGVIDTNDNSADFVRGAPKPRTTVGLPPTGVGLATPASLSSGDATVLSVVVTPGAFPPSPIASVTVDLTALGGSSMQPLLDDGLNGDLVAGDSIFLRRRRSPAHRLPERRGNHP
jgi:predicted extracellular nuclease